MVSSEPLKTARSGGYPEPSVLSITSPNAGAVQDHQMVRDGGQASVCGSPGSVVAANVSPAMSIEPPLSRVRLSNASFAGRSAKCNRNVNRPGIKFVGS